MRKYADTDAMLIEFGKWQENERKNADKYTFLEEVINYIQDFPTMATSEDCISRSVVISYIDRLTNSGTGKGKSLEYLRKFIEKSPFVVPTLSAKEVDAFYEELYKLQASEGKKGSDPQAWTLKEVERWSHMVEQFNRQKAESFVWIPCSERLPEPETEVLVSFNDGTVKTLWQKWAISEGGNYPGEPLAYIMDGYFPETEEDWEKYKMYAVAWMPLPKAYTTV